MTRLATILLLLALTIVEFRALALLHGGNWRGLIPAINYRVAEGTWDWKHSAQRVLLPKLALRAVHFLRADPVQVWITFVFLALLLANCLTYFLTASHWPELAAGITVACAAGFVALQDHQIMMGADLVDLSVWFAFAYAVFSARPWYWFAALFAIELHNREVAVFIPLYLAARCLLPLPHWRDWRHWGWACCPSPLCRWE